MKKAVKQENCFIRPLIYYRIKNIRMAGALTAGGKRETIK
jgi:hypothetical protein